MGAQGPAGPQGPPGASPWTLNGQATCYSQGFVGVGVCDPQALLHVSGGDVLLDGAASGHAIEVRDGSGAPAVRLGSDRAGGSSITLANSAASPVETVRILGDVTDSGQIHLGAAAGLVTVLIRGDALGTGAGGMMFNNAEGLPRLLLGVEASGGGGLGLRAADESSAILLQGESANSGGLVSVRNSEAEETVHLLGDDGADAGRINVFNRSGTLLVSTISLEARDAATNTGGRLIMREEDGTTTLIIDSQHVSGGGSTLAMYDGGGMLTHSMNAAQRTFTMRNSAGVPTISFNAQTVTKNCIVQTSRGNRQMYCQESPEAWFEDFGSGQLVNGACRVDLDPLFLETVAISERHPIKVFITLNDECFGVWVEKGDSYFVVHELMNGVHNARFDYRVVAKHKGLEGARLEPFEDSADEAMLVGGAPQPTPNDGTVREPDQPVRMIPGARPKGDQTRGVVPRTVAEPIATRWPAGVEGKP